MPRIKTIEELTRELAAKQKKVGRLQKKKDALLTKVEAIDRRIGLLTGAAVKTRGPAKNGRKTRRGRGPGGKGLASYLQQVLAKASTAGLRAKEIAQAVANAGYKSASKNFYGIVAAALRDKNKFRRLRRGVYSLK